MGSTDVSGKSRGIAGFYQDFLDNPLKYINQEIDSGVIGVNHLHITRSMHYMFGKGTDKPWDFGVTLDPGVMQFEYKQEFLDFIGKSLDMANSIHKTKVPFEYAELLGAYPFQQKDGRRDSQIFSLTGSIIKGSDTKNTILHIDDGKEYPVDSPPVKINVYDLDGAKMVDYLLAVWFALEEPY